MIPARHPVVHQLVAALIVGALVVGALAFGLSACSSESSDLSGAGRTIAPAISAPATPAAPVLQPGRPGEPNVLVTGGSPAPTTAAVDPDDTLFMQEMISHHAQALRIVVIVRDLLSDKQTKAIASRIEAGQRPEIDAMASWLTAHGQDVPLEARYPLATPSAHHHSMPGMARADQLEALARTRTPEADRMFLSLMIAHHQGALTMALDQRKHGADDRTTELSDDISVTQTAEIGHMRQMLSRLST